VTAKISKRLQGLTFFGERYIH